MAHLQSRRLVKSPKWRTHWLHALWGRLGHTQVLTTQASKEVSTCNGCRLDILLADIPTTMPVFSKAKPCNNVEANNESTKLHKACWKTWPRTIARSTMLTRTVTQRDGRPSALKGGPMGLRKAQGLSPQDGQPLGLAFAQNHPSTPPADSFALKLQMPKALIPPLAHVCTSIICFAYTQQPPKCMRCNGLSMGTAVSLQLLNAVPALPEQGCSPVPERHGKK